MSIADKIRALLRELEAEASLMPYAYNATRKSFDPARDTVYYSGPLWDDAELVAGIESLLTGRWLAAGERVAKFELEFSRKYGSKASVMVNSGSSANLVMLAAAKDVHHWAGGDEMIVSPVGFPTTIAPIVQNGLAPVFVDIDMSDLNFDLEQVDRAVTSRTRAILLSPVLGNPPQMDRLLEIVDRHKLLLLLDGCDSLGTRWRGRELSSYAYAASCSFYPAHHITTGEGGMVSSMSREFIDVARSFAWWGRDCYCVGAANLLAEGTCKKRFSCWLDDCAEVVDHKYVFTKMGYNLKPLDLQGAIGSQQLAKADAIHAARRTLKGQVGALFERHVSGLKVPSELADAETSWFGVPLVCDTPELKRSLVAHLERHRIQTRNYFAGNILLHPGYRHLDEAARFPVANQVLARVFFVGCHPSYSPEILAYIEGVLQSFGSS